MVFSDSICKDCPKTDRNTGAYTVFYQGVTIYHYKHVLSPFAQSSAESEYNAACIAGISIEYFRMLNN